MPRANRNRLTSGILLAGLLTALWPPLMFAGISSKETTERSQEIEQMTAIERDRLQRNWLTFLALPDDRKQHFRQLHQQLEDDRKAGSGQLQETMQTYSLWLQTLTPGQRADLREAKDPARKLELVKKFKAEQDQRQEGRLLNDSAYDSSHGRDRFSFGSKRPRQGSKPLEPQELRAVMNALADELPRTDREELEGLDKVREKWTLYRRVLERSILQAESPREWPTPQQQHAIGKALGTSEQAERLEKIDQPPLKRMMFGGMLFNSLRADMMNDAAPYQPKPGQLEAIFEKLDHTERDTLMQLPAEEMSQKLLQRFRSQNNDPDYLEFDKQRREFQEFTRKLFAEFQWGGRFGNPPGGRDRPPFRPGGPEGGEGPDRPPRDRNGRPRPPGPPND